MEFLKEIKTLLREIGEEGGRKVFQSFIFIRAPPPPQFADHSVRATAAAEAAPAHAERKEGFISAMDGRGGW